MDGWQPICEPLPRLRCIFFVYNRYRLQQTTHAKLLLLVSSRAARRPRRTRAFLLEDPAGEGALVLGDALGEPAVKRARAVNNSIDEGTNNERVEEKRETLTA